MVKKNRIYVILIIFIAIAIIGAWYGLNYAAYADYELSDEAQHYVYSSHNNILKVSLEGEIPAQTSLILQTQGMSATNMISKSRKIYEDLLTDQSSDIILSGEENCKSDYATTYSMVVCTEFEDEVSKNVLLNSGCEERNDNNPNVGLDIMVCTKYNFEEAVKDVDCRVQLIATGDSPKTFDMIYGTARMNNGVLTCKIDVEPLRGENRFTSGTYVDWKLNGQFDRPNDSEEESIEVPEEVENPVEEEVVEEETTEEVEEKSTETEEETSTSTPIGTTEEVDEIENEGIFAGITAWFNKLKNTFLKIFKLQPVN